MEEKGVDDTRHFVPRSRAPTQYPEGLDARGLKRPYAVESTLMPTDPFEDEAQPRGRRALSSQFGPVESGGEPDIAQHLQVALESVQNAEQDPLTHGFHAYPARMHYAIARHLLPVLSREGEIVLDPFVGSGTVLVEAMLAGRQSVGVDLNPLALRLADVKTFPRDGEGRSRLIGLAESIAAASEERVRARVPVMAKLSRDEASWYDGHVLKELAGLFEEIQKVEAQQDRRALEMVFSSIVVKFSRQRAETAEEIAPKQIRKGIVTEFFLRKTRELVARWEDLVAALPKEVLFPRLKLGDARRLPALVDSKLQVDLVLTSPPYGGTYDYVRHHARRYPWLGIDAERLLEGELGARRYLSEHHDGARRWENELLQVLHALYRTLRHRGLAVFVVGDAEVGGERISALDQFGALGEECGFIPLAYASQPRPDWRGGAPRAEHLIALERR